MKIGFDNDKYLAMQSEHISERIKKFDNKLYLEFGGKLFDDYHASRVLPGFQPDSKLQMLLQLKEQAEIVIVISAEDIISSKVRGDYGITYDLDVLRLIEMVQGAVAHAQGNGLTAQVERQLYAAPTPLSGQIHAALSAQAEALGVSHRVMVSGAGHDAMIMAGFAPTGLIFVPSRGGISHAPEEWTDYAQLARGIDVIFATIRQMAGAMPR